MLGPLFIVQVLLLMTLILLALPLSQLDIDILQYHDLNGEFIIPHYPLYSTKEEVRELKKPTNNQQGNTGRGYSPDFCKSNEVVLSFTISLTTPRSFCLPYWGRSGLYS